MGRRREDYCNLSKSCAPYKSAQTTTVDRGICWRSGGIVCLENIYVDEHGHAELTEAPLALFHSDSTLDALIYFPSCAFSLSVSAEGTTTPQCDITRAADMCASAARDTCSHCCEFVRLRPPPPPPPWRATVATHLCDFTPPRKENNATFRTPPAGSFDQSIDRGRLCRQFPRRCRDS